MPSRQNVIWAIFRRNFSSYFINPTGYVFITVFIGLGAIAAFWDEGFFLSNLASLDRLNGHFPLLLLFFVPSLTMNLWSEERRRATDELLFTLPCRDVDVVLGKYFAALGIYTVALVFSLSHLFVLARLGNPDLGLMFANYFGYWLAGASLLAVGMTASLLTINGTVAFILGALFCGTFVFVHHGEGVLGERLGEAAKTMGLVHHFQVFASGAVRIASVLYFLFLTVVMLYVNVALLRRRHQRGSATSVGKDLHLFLRSGSLAAIAVALCAFAGRANWTVDATAERLHTLQAQTQAILSQIPEDRPVYVQAFFSNEVPEQLIQTRLDLINILKRMDEIGGNRLILSIHDTEPYTALATEAAENYNIRPFQAADFSTGRSFTKDIFMGLVFTSGPEEFVIPVFYPGLPVEYEIVRSIRVVSNSDRRKLGIVSTDAKLFGGFDFQSMNSTPDWAIVNELRKQYDVEQIQASGPYPDDLDALLVPMPSTLTQPEMDAVRNEILSGTPTLVVDDPVPAFNLNLAPPLRKDAGGNPFQNQGRPPAEPKGDIDSFMASLGLMWNTRNVVWTEHNPHPMIEAMPEIVFLGAHAGNLEPFNAESTITSGLQEVVLMLPGSLQAGGDPTAGFQHTPLLRTGRDSGTTLSIDEADPQNARRRALIMQHFLFGTRFTDDIMRVSRRRTPDGHTLAMLVTGTPSPSSGQADAAADSSPVRVVMISDVDLFSEQFFQLRRRGASGIQLDNVTFTLNCIDYLAGDESFIDLRKHRPQHRTLTLLEDRTSAFTRAHRGTQETAELEANEEIQAAQQRLDQKVAELRQRTDLDERTKSIMLRSLEDVENRRLEVQKTSIEERKNSRIFKARTDMETSIASIQREIKWWAAALPPVPTLILAIILFANRYKREKIGVPSQRRVGSSA
jgi:ABC-2 type transport system permease protein